MYKMCLFPLWCVSRSQTYCFLFQIPINSFYINNYVEFFTFNTHASIAYPNSNICTQVIVSNIIVVLLGYPDFGTSYHLLIHLLLPKTLDVNTQKHFLVVLSTLVTHHVICTVDICLCNELECLVEDLIMSFRIIYKTR